MTSETLQDLSKKLCVFQSSFDSSKVDRKEALEFANQLQELSKFIICSFYRKRKINDETGFAREVKKPKDAGNGYDLPGNFLQLSPSYIDTRGTGENDTSLNWDTLSSSSSSSSSFSDMPSHSSGTKSSRFLDRDHQCSPKLSNSRVASRYDDDSTSHQLKKQHIENTEESFNRNIIPKPSNPVAGSGIDSKVLKEQQIGNIKESSMNISQKDDVILRKSSSLVAGSGIDSISRENILSFMAKNMPQQSKIQRNTEVVQAVEKVPKFSQSECGCGYKGDKDEQKFSTSVVNHLKKYFPHHLKTKKHVFYFMAFSCLDRIMCENCSKCTRLPVDVFIKSIEDSSGNRRPAVRYNYNAHYSYLAFITIEPLNQA